MTIRIYLWGNGSYETTALGGNGNAIIVYGSATSATGLPASITATSGTPQTTTVGSAFASPLVVTVTDTHGNPMPGVTVTFTAPSSGEQRHVRQRECHDQRHHQQQRPAVGSHHRQQPGRQLQRHSLNQRR